MNEYEKQTFRALVDELFVEGVNPLVLESRNNYVSPRYVEEKLERCKSAISCIESLLERVE